MSPQIPATKVLLLPDSRRDDSAAAVPVRRYRIARLRLGGLAEPGEKRFEHLAHVYD